VIHSVLTEIGGIGIYGVISLLLFFTVFMGVLLWISRIRAPYTQKMKNLPLESDISIQGDRR
jgi:hypothetical protein